MKKYLDNLDEEKLLFLFNLKKDLDEKRINLNYAKEQIRNKGYKIKAHEIAYIEQKYKEYDEKECIAEDISKMLDLYQEFLEIDFLYLKDTHPISNYLEENTKIKELIKKIKNKKNEKFILNEWLEIYDYLEKYKIHYTRKQNQLYSVLEKKGFDRPTTTMWTFDDYIKNLINESRDLLKSEKIEEFLSKQENLCYYLQDLIDKEELVLYPTSLVLINDEEFEEMKVGDLEIGYAFKSVDKKEVKTESFEQELRALLTKYKPSTSEILEVSQGKLSLEQINLIFKNMPVDISFVDENDTVCFYTDTKNRVFPRSKNVIGRNVYNCHPRESVHKVREIIEKFRSGKEDEVDFWINKNDVFIYIKYIALRDERGRYKGVLEMMQEASYIRNLQGEKRLLKWEKENEEKADEDDNLEINSNTKLSYLLKVKPELKEYLPKINSKFNMLNTAFGKLMIPKATIKIMSERTGVEEKELIEKIKEFMEK